MHIDKASNEVKPEICEPVNFKTVGVTEIVKLMLEMEEPKMATHM
jgi:hypothetical protein